MKGVADGIGCGLYSQVDTADLFLWQCGSAVMIGLFRILKNCGEE